MFHVALSSGSVFYAIYQLLTKRVQRMKENNEFYLVAVSENAAQLATQPRCGGRSNLQGLAHMMRGLGFRIVVFKMDPTLFGVPQSRPRLYIVCAIAPI